MANIIVTGIPELDRKLKAMGAKLSNKFARSALRKAGKRIREAAQTNLDANSSVVTGDLRRGLKVRSMKRSRERVGIIVMTTFGDHEDPGFGGAEVEFGTKHATQKAFLRPAIYDNEQALVDMVVADVNATINEMAVSGG